MNLKEARFKTVLRYAKDISGLTLEEISEKTGISLSQIQRYFSDEDYYPSPIKLVAICKALNTTLPIEWMLQQVKETSPKWNGYHSVSKELSDVINQIITALEDGIITPVERERIYKEAVEAMEALKSLLRKLEEKEEVR